MIIAVMDAQGAGLGQTIIKKLRKTSGINPTIVALGTNSQASANMVKAGADFAIIGEEAITVFCHEQKVDCIIGPIGILCTGGINGEITCQISSAIYEIDCTKYIIPLQKHGIYISGTRTLQIKEIIEDIISHIKASMPLPIKS